MAFYFRLKDKVFKGPNRITIGRGAPFDHLNEERSIARTHCSLIMKNKKFFIKSLSTDAIVTINNKQVTVNKYEKISPSDEIYIDKFKLDLLPSYEGKDYTVINMFSSPVAKLSRIGFWKQFIFISIGLFAMGFIPELMGFLPKESIEDHISVSLFIVLIITIQFRIMGKLFGSYDKLLVNEVVVGKTGITILN